MIADEPVRVVICFMLPDAPCLHWFVIDFVTRHLDVHDPGGGRRHRRDRRGCRHWVALSLRHAHGVHVFDVFVVPCAVHRFGRGEAELHDEGEFRSWEYRDDRDDVLIMQVIWIQSNFLDQYSFGSLTYFYIHFFLISIIFSRFH